MRSFWIAIGVLAAIVAVLWWRSGPSDADARVRNSTVAMETNPEQAPSANHKASARTLVVPGHRGDEGIAKSAESNSAAPGIGLRTPTPGSVLPPDMTDDASVTTATTLPSGAQGGAATTDDEQALADELMDSSDQAGGEDIDDALDDGSVPLPGNHDEGEDSPAPAASGAPATIDGKYIIAGKGTIEEPFEITWDLLILASQTYQPRQGKTDIPPQVAAVNGKRIRIAGYFAVPIASTDPKEVLFMLNMWDGCCIGVPPSPYDAIEVRLKEPLSGGKQFVNYATLTGTLSVDPYVQNGWLLGMYVMPDGELEIGL